MSAPIDLTSSAVVPKSWSRCANQYGISPTHRRPLDARRDDAGHLALREQLLPVSRPELERLETVVGKTGHSIILSDNRGTILSAASHRHYRSDFQSARLSTGQCWNEALRGTNGIGTCIAEHAPVLIHGDQHYVRAHHNLSCAAAPIFDENHQLLAVLDTSTVNPDRDPTRALHTLAMVSESARRIEQDWFRHRHAGDWLLELQTTGAAIALYALSDALSVIGLDASAHQNLSLDASWLGFDLSEHLDKPSFESLLDTLDSGLQYHVPILAQGQFLGFGHLRAPTQTVSLEAYTPPRARPSQLDQLHAGDATVRECARKAKRLIEHDVALLICGETGVGKDRFVTALHADSSRRDGPLVTVNCASIPTELIESELFGHAPGAFTGARQQGHRGKFAEADGGILFLDEIGDMPLALQSRLLRAVETGRVTPVGGSGEIQVDVHIISATHRDLDARVRDGLFRQDLLYRLRGLAIELPSVRARSDLRALLPRLLSQLSPNHHLSAAALDALCAPPWVGNFREINQCLKASIALADRLTLEVADLIGMPDGGHHDLLSQVQSTHHSAIDDAIAACDGNVTHAAKRLGISRATLYRKRAAPTE